MTATPAARRGGPDRLSWLRRLPAAPVIAVDDRAVDRFLEHRARPRSRPAAAAAQGMVAASAAGPACSRGGAPAPGTSWARAAWLLVTGLVVSPIVWGYLAIVAVAIVSEAAAVAAVADAAGGVLAVRACSAGAEPGLAAAVGRDAGADACFPRPACRSRAVRAVAARAAAPGGVMLILYWIWSQPSHLSRGIPTRDGDMVVLVDQNSRRSRSCQRSPRSMPLV